MFFVGGGGLGGGLGTAAMMARRHIRHPQGRGEGGPPKPLRTSLVHLVSCANTDVVFLIHVHEMPNGNVCIQQVDPPPLQGKTEAGNIRPDPQGNIDHTGKFEEACQFKRRQRSDGSVEFVSVKFSNRDLGLTADPHTRSLTTTSDARMATYRVFHAVVLETQERPLTPPPNVAPHLASASGSAPYDPYGTNVYVAPPPPPPPPSQPVLPSPQQRVYHPAAAALQRSVSVPNQSSSYSKAPQALPFELPRRSPSASESASSLPVAAAGRYTPAPPESSSAASQQQRYIAPSATARSPDDGQDELPPPSYEDYVQATSTTTSTSSQSPPQPQPRPQTTPQQLAWQQEMQQQALRANPRVAAAVTNAVISAIQGGPVAEDMQIRLTNIATGTVMVFGVDFVNKLRVCMRLLSPPPRAQQNMRVTEKGEVQHTGARGPWAQFEFVEREGGALCPIAQAFLQDPSVERLVYIRSVANIGKTNRSGTPDFYLGMAPDGKLIGNAAQGDDSLFVLTVLQGSHQLAPGLARMGIADPRSRLLHSLLASSPLECGFELTDEQKRQFYLEGYIQLPGLVDQPLIDAALTVINRQLGTPMPEGGIHRNEKGHPVLSGTVQGSREILNLLLRTPAWSAAQSLIGRGKVARPWGGQVALRPPEVDPEVLENGTLQPESDLNWHIDGMDEGNLTPFTILLGVSLSDQLVDGIGNFTVFPGSNHIIQRFVSQYGSHEFMNHESRRLLPIGAAKQLLARAGDVVIAHPKMAHRGGRNASPHIRYQVYFRLVHIRHADLWEIAWQDDGWVEFEGMTEVVNEMRMLDLNLSDARDPALEAKLRGM